MWSIQSYAWILDMTNNWTPFLSGFTTNPIARKRFDGIQGITGNSMAYFYVLRSYWEALHGIPCMMFYYPSRFTPAVNVTERVKQVYEVIPEEIQVWQDINDPENEKFWK